ncbi:unnamed protein product [Symbiodinium pilosum]|uniref:Uncharacterized protein n=1 Tax=Symbiodinium pilosum TaxID=2952 RepID=A0A812SSE1_SYMPI|nr:unnamed protein product [Symbiodinium pilosum]
MLRWMTTLTFSEKYMFFELFSGEGAVTRVWHQHGYATASYDLLYGDPMDFLSSKGYSIALWTVLNECVDAMNMIGPACGSWGIPARATSMRSTINPYGRVGIECVDANNCLVSRLVLLILLMMAKHTQWVVEQPSQSLLPKHHRWDWLVNRIAYVYQQSLWMMLHGAPSPKPTLLMSPMRTIYMLDLGVLTKSEREARTSLKTTRIVASI